MYIEVLQPTYNMRNFLFILLLICSSHAFAQTEQTEQTEDKFQSFYNAEKYDSIFSLFSAETKKALPLDNITAFLQNMQSQFGPITKRQLIKSEGKNASYKASFERGTFIWNIAVDKHLSILGFTFVPDKNARNITKLQLPFKGQWDVVWGGDTKELNYHVQSEAQKNAFDILIKDNTGNSFKTDGKHNEDYYAFGKELTAPCDGEIMMVIDGVKDNVPGTMNPSYVTGNTVIIKTVNNEFLLFAHFKNHSVKVKEGQKVKQGQLLGLCGNSGNSSEPHLHFHIQNVENMNMATGIKCYFDKLVVNGELKTDYSPIQKDKIKN
jgi:murein DD-endopeptidase MepM/ murein hydrolase activator NlpD